jgi:hypothetical protein
MGEANKAQAGLICGSEHVRRARCGNTARRDLWRGGRVTGRSTLTCGNKIGRIKMVQLAQKAKRDKYEDMAHKR